MLRPNRTDALIRFSVAILLIMVISGCGAEHTTLFQCSDGSLLEISVGREDDRISVRHGGLSEQLYLRSHAQGTLYEGIRYRVLLRDDQALLDTGRQKMDCRLKGLAR